MALVTLTSSCNFSVAKESQTQELELPNQADNDQYFEIYKSINGSKTIQEFDIEYRAIVIQLISEYAMGRFEFCHNHQCKESISVLFEDQDYNVIDWIYYNQKTNIKYKTRFGRYFCDQCMNKAVEINCGCKCKNCSQFIYCPNDFIIATNSTSPKCRGCKVSLCANHQGNICHVCQDLKNGFEFKLSHEPLPSKYDFAAKCNGCDNILYFKEDDEIITTCDYCLKEISEEQSQNADKSMANQQQLKRWECKICHRTYKSQHTLKSHSKVHDENNPIKCKYCGKMWSKMAALKRHLSVHSDERPFQCEICHKRYKLLNSLKTHKKLHSDGKPYKCKYCNKSYSIRRDLNHHQKSHTSKFQCKICNKIFKYKNNLKVHSVIHGDNAFECKYCNKKFARDRNLKIHIRIHTNERPFQCKICNMSFQAKSTLTRHLRIHTGERPYKCKYCPKAFKAKNNLTVHERIHTGERPYKCRFCDKQYCSSSGLVTHNKKYHANFS